MLKALKILLTLLLLFIIGAAFAITWMIYFKDSGNQGERETKFPEVQEDKGDFRFAVCGDPHSNCKVYKKVFQSAQKRKVSFLINVGDLTRVGAESEFYEGKRLMADFPYKTYLVMGGHDMTGEGRRWFRKYFGKDHQSFNQGKAHFVVLNNADQKEGISKDQLDWLEKDLEENNLPLKFVFVHQPLAFPYADPEEIGYLTEKSQEAEQDLVEILKRNHVNVVFAGHLHSYLTYQFGDISAIITGGAGGPIYSMPFLADTPYHYVLVTVKGTEYYPEKIEINN